MTTTNQWDDKSKLPEDVYHIAFEHGTERAGSSQLDNEKGDGMFHCRVCNLPLFSSTTKFNSGTGWPSFFDPVSPEAIGTQEDKKFFRTRTEVHCSRCHAHLGHVFPDGPAPTGQRYCMNGTVLHFVATNESTRDQN